VVARGLLGWSVPTYRPSRLSRSPSRSFRRRFSLSAPAHPRRFFSPSTPLIFRSSSSLLVASDRSSSADTRKKYAANDGARGPERAREREREREREGEGRVRVGKGERGERGRESRRDTRGEKRKEKGTSARATQGRPCVHARAHILILAGIRRSCATHMYRAGLELRNFVQIAREGSRP
jgi:hypothetical protein